MEGKIKICYASNRDGYGLMETSAWSVRKHFGDNVELYCITDSYWKPRVHGMKVANPTEALMSASVFPDWWNRPLPFHSMFVLAIPLMAAFKDADTVVYLESDTLVVSDKAADALREACGDNCLYEVRAATDIAAFRRTRNRMLLEEIDARDRKCLSQLFERNDPSTRDYVNAGVLILNLKRIRENGLAWYRSRLENFWRGILLGKYPFTTQEFVNVFMDVDASLDRRLNALMNDAEVSEDPLILHWAGFADKRDMIAMANAHGYTPLAAWSRMIPAFPHDMSGKRQLILYISHIVNGETVWRYRKLVSDLSNMDVDVLWCRNMKPGDATRLPDDVWSYEFTDDEVNAKKEYLFLDDNGRPIPGQYPHPQWLLLTLSERYDYDYYWQMEYDNVFTGDWSTLFYAANTYGHDLVCDTTFRLDGSRGWPSWVHCALEPVDDLSESEVCIASMCRVSRRFAKRLVEYYNSHGKSSGVWFERVYPMLAVDEFSLLDLSKIGLFNAGNVARYGMMHCAKSNIVMHDVIARSSSSKAVLRSGNTRSGFLAFLDSFRKKGLLDLKWVEVGSFSGESTRLLLDSGIVSHAWCIDIWRPFDDGWYINSCIFEAESEFDRIVNGAGGRITKLKGTFEEHEPVVRDATPDVVYIDANHKYDYVKKDIATALRIKPAIAVSGHDYDFEDVRRAVDEAFVKPDDTFADNSWIVYRKDRW